MLSTSHRLKRDADFRLIYKHGRRVQRQLLRLVFLPVSQNSKRFAFVVSKKDLPKAAVRNRVKRILRSAMRENLGKIKPGYDVIIQARAAAKTAQPMALREEQKKLLSQAKLMT